METHGKWHWLYKIRNLGSFFPANKTQSNRNQDIFWKISVKMVKFRSWKTLKSHGKGHGKSWSFKCPKEYEPCKRVFILYSISVVVHRVSLFIFARQQRVEVVPSWDPRLIERLIHGEVCNEIFKNAVGDRESRVIWRVIFYTWPILFSEKHQRYIFVTILALSSSFILLTRRIRTFLK